MKRWIIAVAVSSCFAHAQGLDLSGTYRANDGGIYYVEQSGSTLWWAGMSLDGGLQADEQWHRGLRFTNVFRGTIDGGTIVGEWADVSRGVSLSHGALTLTFGTSGGAVQLVRVSASGGFGATIWTQSDPLDDVKFNGTTKNLFSRFDDVHKNDASTIHDNLKPYRDQTVLYGHLTVQKPNPDSDSQFPHVNYGAPFTSPSLPTYYKDFAHEGRSFDEFACFNPDGDGDKDADFALRVRVDLDKLEPDFYTTGWGDRTTGPLLFATKFQDPRTQAFLGYGGAEAYLGAEAIMYGRSGECSRFGVSPKNGGPSELPGWADLGSNSVLVNGRPINGALARKATAPSCDFVQPCPLPSGPLGIDLGSLLFIRDAYVRITGALVLDCGRGTHDCADDPDELDDAAALQNQELHPIYSIDLINYPFRPQDILAVARPNLTGAWSGSDGSTYYVRQIGNTIWWMGQMRDRQPMQPGTSFPIIGGLELAPAFAASDPACSSSPPQCWAFTNVFQGTLNEPPGQNGVIQGDWAGVPQSTSPGSSGGSMKFFVDSNNKIIVPASASIFPIILEKLYEPEDASPPDSELTMGAPQLVSDGRLFVTSATSFTIISSDGESGVQNLWERSFAHGTNPPGYTALAGASTSLTMSGADGAYQLDFYATDNAGNDETPAHSWLVTLDNTPPQITVDQPAAIRYRHDATLELDYHIADAGSGVQSSTVTMDGATRLRDGTALGPHQRINLLTQMTPGTHTFAVVAGDHLDNSASRSVTFFIIVTPDGLHSDLQRFLDAGKISVDRGTPLLGLLDAAARTAGNCMEADRIYQAFIDELSGKKIDPTAARILIADARYLIAHCP
jgi:hypothetical protein